MILRVFLLIAVFNCSVVNNIRSQAVADTARLSFDSLLHKVADAQPVYNTFAGHAKLNWDDGKTEQNFQATIRMKKDSLVWMSISGAMSVEGARVLILPDTFELLNKVSNEFLGRGFNYLNNWILFPVNFAMLQQIIAGEKLDIRPKASTAAFENNAYVIYYESNYLLEKVWVDTLNYTISKILLKDKLLTQQMSITFGSYNQLEGKPFSYHREIEVNRDGVILKLTIDFTKVKLNENQAYPFEVSGKYKHIHED